MRMVAFSNFFDKLFFMLDRADFNLLLIIDFGAYALIFVVALLCCLFSVRVRALKKVPFLHLTKLFTAITVVVFLCRYSPKNSLAAAAIFYAVGLLLYALLRAIKPKKERVEVMGVGLPIEQSVKEFKPPQSVLPPSKANVRLDHALSITDKLLIKNLGRADRQELEKIKTQLTVLKVKNTLSPQEGEGLNLTFNTLLKLMAKYDL